MRRVVRFILLKPVLWAVQKFSSKPDRKRIFKALDKLYADIIIEQHKKGIVIPFEEHAGKFIIFSDQHKGAKNGADDFMTSEPNYMAALDYYLQNNFCFISLGDGEELWENSLGDVKKNYENTFEIEKKFLQENAFVKIFGNHDLYWGNDPFAWWQVKKIYGEDLKIYEGLVLAVSIGDKQFHIFCTHGHQGDAQSDGNWFSKFFVSKIWAPLQAYLRINPNTPAYNNEKKTLHNEIMYEWSAAQKDILLITGHTHQPVFKSLTQIERLYKQMETAIANKDEAAMTETKKQIQKIEKHFTAISVDYPVMKPSYFNSGCCCFDDGDITGIEIEKGSIRLIKWTKENEVAKREVLEEILLGELIKEL
ncbi:MAG: metallophosphoesterase [Chitinophagaceae bacterium]